MDYWIEILEYFGVALGLMSGTLVVIHEYFTIYHALLFRPRLTTSEQRPKIWLIDSPNSTDFRRWLLRLRRAAKRYIEFGCWYRIRIRPRRFDPRSLFWSSVRIAFVISAILAWFGEHHKFQESQRQIASLNQPTAAPVEAPAPAQSVPAQSVPGGPRFAVQVKACDQRAEAEDLAYRLSEQYGLQTLVAPIEAGGKTLYRVRLLVQNKDQAESLANTFLRTEKLKVWIVALQ